eukprot:CAMPEP_0184703470 /NCGR_PEP_ID=MMETSP0313-20130426/27908_1 /TAXON_ID=2792 /ORGANISM="Porphyridium aerugineum, Strain SAG 1380-2" /LENGTH=141 /DNA_ID=CAMNT_0027164239 /DNA_START=44 /DNA_END=466 /DNA_ORIENTATION=-
MIDLHSSFAIIRMNLETIKSQPRLCYPSTATRNMEMAENPDNRRDNLRKVSSHACSDSSSLLSVTSLPSSPRTKIPNRNEICRQQSAPDTKTYSSSSSSCSPQETRINHDYFLHEQRFRLLENVSLLKDKPKRIRSSDFVR